MSTTSETSGLPDYRQTAEELALTRQHALEIDKGAMEFEFGEYELIDLPTNRVLLRPLGEPEGDQDYQEGDMFVLYMTEGHLTIDDYIREFYDYPDLARPWL